MTKFLIAAVLICGLIGLKAQTKPRQWNPSLKAVTLEDTYIEEMPDTPKVKYQYFYKATVGINEWQRSADTMNYVLNQVGKSMSVDQADYHRALFYRNFSKLQFSLDSVQVFPEIIPTNGKPQKPKK